MEFFFGGGGGDMEIEEEKKVYNCQAYGEVEVKIKIKVYCQLCGDLLMQEVYGDGKIRVYPCENCCRLKSFLEVLWK